MKRFFYFLLSIIFLVSLTACSLNNSKKPSAISSDFYSVDLFSESISQLTDFKCDAIYQNKSITIEGARAKDLYKLLHNATIREEQTPTCSNDNYVYMVFYDGPEGYFSDNLNKCFGAYTIYDDGLLKFSLSPLHSASFDYKVEIGLFDSVIDIISDTN